MKITFVTLTLLSGSHLSRAFQTQPFSSCVYGSVKGANNLPRLWYRELDEDDDNDAMLQVQTRAPPGFDMKENLLKQRAATKSSAMNVPLIRALLLNQGLILTVATVLSAVLLISSDGFDSFGHLNEIFHWSGDGNIDLSLTPARLLLGVAVSVPIVAFGKVIENSDNRRFANINFSTITMVFTLFGRRQAPPDTFRPSDLKGKRYPTTTTAEALLQSFVLSTVTGICEETVFRMEVPGLLNHYFGGFPILPLVGQAVLFALGHSQPRTSIGENGIVIGLQLINGSWFGLVYLLTGGDLIVCMVAHAVYDFVVFFNTWLDSNGQIEYAEKMWSAPLPPDVQRDVDNILRTNIKIDPKVFNLIKRLFYLFDFDKNKALSKSEVRKGFSYLALERAGLPPPQDQVDALFDKYTSVDDKSRLTFADFLRLYTTSLSAK